MDIKQSFKNLISETGIMVGESMDDVSGLLKDTLNKFYDVKDLTKEKLVALANDLIALSPIIEQTGYKSKEINIGLSLPPKVVFHFEKVADISREQIDQILENNAEKPLLRVIVQTLVTADEFQQKITPGSFRFSEIDIEIGVPPRVNVKLIPAG